MWLSWFHPQQPAVLPFVVTAKSQVLTLVHKTPHGVPGSHWAGISFLHFLSSSPISLILLFKNGKHSSFSGHLHFSPFYLLYPHTRCLYSSFLHSMWICAEYYQGEPSLITLSVSDLHHSQSHYSAYNSSSPLPPLGISFVFVSLPLPCTEKAMTPPTPVLLLVPWMEGWKLQSMGSLSWTRTHSTFHFSPDALERYYSQCSCLESQG